MAGGRARTLPFTNLRLLRKNGAVSVFAAVGRDGRPAVVKMLDEARARDDAIGERRFRREVLIASTLYHPSLARCLGHGDGWIAFEWLEDSLVERVKAARYKSDPELVRPLLRDIAAVLGYIHARGVVHGDLKPAHVMFRAEQIVLIDFGIAALVSDDPLSGVELTGSPAWMAPEQVAGGAAGPPSDIWSLCAIGAWLMTGAPEIEGTAEEMLAARARADVQFDLSTIRRKDPELADLLASGLGQAKYRPDAAAIVRRLALTQ
ncbi:serine/threonine-protein kinase [Nitratireductor sp. GCM10026969]|uniref:serine/threonine-protein kinase n=1 Tax=Nitratireductor sp. GCM10026969 TaxID=3252645 RepID=UPI003623951F